MNDGPPVKSLTDRELLEEITGHLRHLRAVLAPWETIIRGNGNGTVSYVQAAGMRRAVKRAAREDL